jgi:hypothetical protein
MPWHPDSCNSSSSGRCYPVVRTGAAIFPYLCLWRKFDFLSNSDEHSDVLPWRPDRCNLELFESSRHWWASGRMTRPFGRNLGIRLLWLEIYTESSFEHLEPLLWNEDSKINGVPDYVATLQKTDFVKQNAASHKLTNSPFGHSRTKITLKIKGLLI